MKTYIGQGKKHDRYDIIDVTIKMDNANPFVFTTKNGTFLRFSVTARKEADKFGNTHAVSVWTRDEAAPVAVAEPQPKRQKRAKKA